MDFHDTQPDVSSETQGQIMGQVGNWGKRKRRWRGAGRKGEGEKRALFSPTPLLPCLLHRHFHSPQFPARYTICPWVSEDEPDASIWENEKVCTNPPCDSKGLHKLSRTLKSVVDVLNFNLILVIIILISKIKFTCHKNKYRNF